MPTTEIATLTLTPGADIGDPNNDASRIVNECGNVIAKQPGLKSLRFGPVVEDSSKMQMFIDWDSLDDHKNFLASDSYPGFLKEFKAIFAAPPAFAHVDFEGDLPAAIKAPVVEVATFHFNETTLESHFQGVHDFSELCLKTNPPQKMYGFGIGTTYEELEKDGVKGKAGVLIIGWESVEAHMEFRKTEVYQKNAKSMSHWAGAVEVHHTTLLNFVPS